MNSDLSFISNEKKIVLLVSYWREDINGKIVPADAIIASPIFPRTDEDIAILREHLKEIVEPGVPPARTVTFVNIIRLG